MSCQFLEHFSELEDPRIERCRKHDLLDIILLSHDTIARVMSRLNPEALQRCFIGWVQTVVALHSGEGAVA